MPKIRSIIVFVVHNELRKIRGRLLNGICEVAYQGYNGLLPVEDMNKSNGLGRGGIFFAS